MFLCIETGRKGIVQEIGTISAGLATIKAAMDITGALLGLRKEMAEAEFKYKIIELKEKLIQIKSSLLDSKEENTELRKKILELKMKKDIDNSLTFDKNVYWKREENGKQEVTYCSPCWDGHRNLVRLHNLGESHFGCPLCLSVVNLTGQYVNIIIMNEFRASQVKKK